MEAGSQPSDHLNLKLGGGEILVIFGPPGSGKDELLACLAGLVVPKVGVVYHQGQAVLSCPTSERAFVPKIPGVYEEFSVREYLNFFAEVYGVDLYYRTPLVNQALATCRLEGEADRRITTLAFAERKRLSMARAILPDPPLLFLDDPFFRLERGEQQTLRQVLSKVQGRGTTIIATSPGLGEFAEIASFLCLLTSRSVLAYGPVSQLKQGLASFKMMQVQFESGFRRAVSALDAEPRIHHLSVSNQSTNLVRFLFKGTDSELRDLLRALAQQGATIVSYVEDQEFLGRPGRRLPR